MYGTNNTTNHFWNLTGEKLWHKNTVWAENESAYMIFLAYSYVRYIKPQYYLSKRKKSKNITQKEIKFLFAWCSLIFDLTDDSRDTTIKKIPISSFQVNSTYGCKNITSYERPEQKEGWFEGNKGNQIKPTCMNE